MRRKARQATKAENRPRFWGRHAVAAALANPERRIVRIWATREAAAELDIAAAIPVTLPTSPISAGWCRGDAPHQGIVAEVERLEDMLLADLLDRARGRQAAARARPGHRSAQCRRDPALGRRLRRARHRHPGPACAARIGRARQGRGGALETMPWVRVVNLARALDDIAEAGFWRIGLTGEADDDARRSARPAARRAGARRRGRRHAPQYRDAIATRSRGCRSRGIESLNVSNAAAVALYAASVAALSPPARDPSREAVQLRGERGSGRTSAAGLDLVVRRVEQIVLVGARAAPSLANQSGSTWTWQVAQEQQPPHSASNSSKPLSRIFSITLQPAAPRRCVRLPSRVTMVRLAWLSLMQEMGCVRRALC